MPAKDILYALSLPDGVLVRNGPLGVLATDDEAQAMRLAHVRGADSPTLVRYVYAGTWRDWNNACRQSSSEPAAPQPAAEAEAENDRLPKALCDWLSERGLLPDAEEDGSVDLGALIEMLNTHEHELLRSPPDA